jgi:hypothetical protein
VVGRKHRYDWSGGNGRRARTGNSAQGFADVLESAERSGRLGETALASPSGFDGGEIERGNDRKHPGSLTHRWRSAQGWVGLADCTRVSRNHSKTLSVAVGLLAAVGAISLMTGVASGTGRDTDVPTTKPAGTATPFETAAAPKPSTVPDIATTAGTTTPPATSPAAPARQPNPCNLSSDPAPVATSGGSERRADVRAAFVGATDPEVVAAAVATTTWASGRQVSARVASTPYGAIVYIVVPTDFGPVEFGVVEKWFRAIPGLSLYERTDKPSIAVNGCLSGVADPDQLTRVVNDLARAGKVDGFALVVAGDSAQITLLRGDTDRDWTALATTFGSLGSVVSWTVFDAWAAE